MEGIDLGAINETVHQVVALCYTASMDMMRESSGDDSVPGRAAHVFTVIENLMREVNRQLDAVV